MNQKNEFQPLTGFQGLPETGALETSIKGVPAGNQKLVAETVLVSPPSLANYRRTMKSNAVYLVVLKGGGPEGQLAAGRVSGLGISQE